MLVAGLRNAARISVLSRMQQNGMSAGKLQLANHVFAVASGFPSRSTCRASREAPMRRTIAFVVCAVALLGGEAFAAAAKATKQVGVTGCVNPIGLCPAVRIGSGGYFLVGMNLPPPGRRATVRGQLSTNQNFLCPTRLIMRGTLVVSSWRPARGKCTP
jgi:hypothetical protein